MEIRRDDGLLVGDDNDLSGDVRCWGELEVVVRWGDTVVRDLRKDVCKNSGVVDFLSSGVRGLFLQLLFRKDVGVVTGAGGVDSFFSSSSVFLDLQFRLEVNFRGFLTSSLVVVVEEDAVDDTEEDNAVGCLGRTR